MCTFDSPVARCEAMHTMVLTDQTQPQCAIEHGCPPKMACPLCDCFTGVEWVETAGERPVMHHRTVRQAA